MAESILDAVRKADKLPSLPAVAVEILRLLKSEDVSIDELTALIQNDPALTARVLKVVNSSFFAVPRKISSIHQAIMVLGMRSVKVLVLSFSLVDVLEKRKGAFDYVGYWRRSLTTAVAARLLAKATNPVAAEEAFVAGLLSDIGMVAAWRCAQDQYAPVLTQWAQRKRHISEIEYELLGTDHPAMSRELLQTWGLPEPLCRVIGTHHGAGIEELNEEQSTPAWLLHSAVSIADLFCREVPPTELDAIRSRAVEKTGISAGDLEELLAALDAHVQDMAGMLSVQVGETQNYAELQAEAAQQLVQLTMQAERERAAASQKAEEARQEANTAKSLMGELESKVTWLEGQAKRRDGIEHRMRLASEHQRRMLPSSPPELPGVEIGMVYQPAEEISGDFYDFVQLPNGAWAFVIGDVSGHGIEAGILMGMAQKYLSVHLKQLGDPMKAFCRANDDLCQNLDRKSFVTACLVAYHPEARTIKVVRAGHNPPILLNPYREPKLIQFDPGGVSLGITTGQGFERALDFRETTAQPGDMLLMYTDGMAECLNAEEEEFGTKRIVMAMAKTIGKPVSRFFDTVAADMEGFSAGHPQVDDVTAICIRFM